MIEVEVFRYNPEADSAPSTQTVQVPEHFRKAMVLDVLEYLRERDATLAYRRSCREGVCGSDGMNINGVNRLACVTPVGDMLSAGRLIVRPLTGMPVIRDLVVDQTLFFAQYARVQPYLINDGPVPATERRQSPAERAQLDGLYECILCACCTSGCPSWWWNPDGYLGPAALLQAERFLVDSRDTATLKRLAALDDHFSVYRCRDIGNCTWVCPKHLNPMRAISEIRRKLLRSGT